MLAFNTFRDAHIHSAEHRQWFANQIKAMTGGHFDPRSIYSSAQREAPSSAVTTASETKRRAEWSNSSQTNPLRTSNDGSKASESGGTGEEEGEIEVSREPRFSPYPGETDEEWQRRHGFQYLTPGAVKVFDTSRRFREERDAQQAADELAELEEQQEGQKQEEEQEQIWIETVVLQC